MGWTCFLVKLSLSCVVLESVSGFVFCKMYGVPDSPLVQWSVYGGGGVPGISGYSMSSYGGAAMSS